MTYLRYGLRASGLLMALMLLTSIATADESPLSKGDPKVLAAQRFDRGKKLYRQRKLDEALKAFRDAVHLSPSTASYLANLGTTELALGHHRDAAEHLSQAITVVTFSTNYDPERISRLQKHLDKAEQEIATLRVTVNVPGAEVQIDGRFIGKAPIKSAIFLEPGDHTLRASVGSRRPFSRRFTAVKGEELNIDVSFSGSLQDKPMRPQETSGGEGDEPFNAWWLPATMAASTICALTGLGLHLRYADTTLEASELHTALAARSLSCPAVSGADASDCARLDNLASRMHNDDAGATASLSVALGTAAVSSTLVLVHVFSGETKRSPFFSVLLGSTAIITTGLAGAGLGMHAFSARHSDSLDMVRSDTMDPGTGFISAQVVGSLAMTGLLIGYAASAGSDNEADKTSKSSSASTWPHLTVLPYASSSIQGIIIHGTR